jgi:hypothetical protein
VEGHLEAGMIGELVVVPQEEHQIHNLPDRWLSSLMGVTKPPVAKVNHIFKEK